MCLTGLLGGREVLRCKVCQIMGKLHELWTSNNSKLYRVIKKFFLDGSRELTGRRCITGTSSLRSSPKWHSRGTQETSTTTQRRTGARCRPCRSGNYECSWIFKSVQIYFAPKTWIFSCFCRGKKVCFQSYKHNRAESVLNGWTSLYLTNQIQHFRKTESGKKSQICKIIK